MGLLVVTGSATVDIVTKLVFSLTVKHTMLNKGISYLNEATSVALGDVSVVKIVAPNVR